MDLETKEIIKENDVEGELIIKSPCLFDKYLNREAATKESFTDDGWFLTGDCGISNYLRVNEVV